MYKPKSTPKAVKYGAYKLLFGGTGINESNGLRSNPSEFCATLCR